MENLMLAVNVVAPLIIYMAVGSLIKKLHLFTEEQFKALNVVIFKIFIPLALFFDVYETNLSEALLPDLIILVVAGVLTAFFLALFVVSRLVKNLSDGSTIIQGIYRSNYVLFGLTIAQSLCGESGVAQVSAFAAIVVPLFNVLSVILFETRRGGTVKPAKVLLNILKNPLVEAGLLACLFNVLNIPVPQIVASPLSKLGDIASPLALVSLGGMLSFKSIVSHRKYLCGAVFCRLVVLPLSMILISVLLGYRGDTLVMMLAIFGSPTAVASTPMAQTMGGNGKLAGEIVALTSGFSIVTIFLFVLALSGAGMI